VFKPLSEDAQGQCLDLRDGLGLVGSIRHDPREFGNLRNPATVGLTFEFNLERHKATLASDRLPNKPLQPTSGELV